MEKLKLTYGAQKQKIMESQLIYVKKFDPQAMGKAFLSTGCCYLTLSLSHTNTNLCHIIQPHSWPDKPTN